MRLTFLILLISIVCCRAYVDLNDVKKFSSGESLNEWSKESIFGSDNNRPKEFDQDQHFHGHGNGHLNREPMQDVQSESISYYTGENAYQEVKSFYQQPYNNPQSNKGVRSPPSSMFSSGLRDQNPGSEGYRLSLGFVFEMTPPMRHELNTFKRTLRALLKAAIFKKNFPFNEYIWSPYAHSGDGPLYVTADPQAFEKHVNESYPESYIEDEEPTNRDCKAKVFRGLKNAVEVAAPNSFIYLFTHSVPKDVTLFEEIMEIILEKNIRVSIVKMEGCYIDSEKNRWRYDYITAVTTAQVYIITREDFYRTLYYFEKELHATNIVTMGSFNKSPTIDDKPDVFRFPADDSIRKIIVSLAGKRSKVIVWEPQDGIYHLNKSNVLLDLEFIRVYEIRNPKPGNWRIGVNSQAPYNLRIWANSEIDFDYKFISNANTNLQEISDRPIKGSKSMVKIFINPNSDLLSICAIDLKGISLQCMPLIPYKKEDGIFFVDDFASPNTPFFLEVKGVNSHGFALHRWSASAIGASKPEKPTVYMKRKIYAVYGERVDIECRVESMIPVEIKWLKDGVQTGVGKHCSDSCDSVYEIPYATEDDIATYICDASNEIGSDFKSTQLILEAAHNSGAPLSQKTPSVDYTSSQEMHPNPMPPPFTTTTHKTTKTTHKTTKTTHKTTKTTHKTTKTTHQTTKTTHRTTTPTTTPTPKKELSLNYTIRCAVQNGTTYNLTWERSTITNNSDILYPTSDKFIIDSKDLKFANMSQDMWGVYNCKAIGIGGSTSNTTSTVRPSAAYKNEGISFLQKGLKGNPKNMIYSRRKRQADLISSKLRELFRSNQLKRNSSPYGSGNESGSSNDKKK